LRSGNTCALPFACSGVLDMHHKRSLARANFTLLALVGLSLMPSFAANAQEWPIRPISSSCHFGGGGTDLIARVMAQHLSARLASKFSSRTAGRQWSDRPRCPEAVPA
jgi:hypothetical protein